MSEKHLQKCLDPRKQSLYFPDSMLREMRAEAKRLDRSLSWVIQRVWKTGSKHVTAMPTIPDVDA